MSYSLGRNWLCEGAYRYYFVDPSLHPGLVEGVVACFFDPKGAVEEPLLILGMVQFSPGDNARVADSDEWLLGDLFLTEKHPTDAVATGGPLPDRNIEWFKAVGVPLFTIRSMQDVELLMGRVRAAEAPAA